MPKTKKPSATQVIKQYREWRQGPPVGCRFAMLMSRRPDQYGQAMIVIPGQDPHALANELAARVDGFVADPMVAAATLLCPDVDEPALLVRVAQTLGKKAGWRTTLWALPNTPGGPMVAFGIERNIPGPNGAGTLPSEALVLGPFPSFPNTRKAPITAFELFVGVPRERDPKTDKPSTKANVAHVEMILPGPKAFQTTWENSRKGRRRSLGLPPEDPNNPHGSEDDLRAKAKVAFVVPVDLAQLLGCNV